MEVSRPPGPEARVDPLAHHLGIRDDLVGEPEERDVGELFEEMVSDCPRQSLPLAGIHSRGPGQVGLLERVDNHYRGEKPAFKELEFRLAREESTRLALILSGEAQIADLPRELQKDALKRGMKIYTSSFPVDWMTVYLGGQYYLPGDPAFKPDVAWTKKPVRQALNMAINRKELNASVFAGKGTPTYVTGWSDKSEGFNPEWASRFDKMYGFNPARAKELLKEAGYGPGKPLKFKVGAFTEPGGSA